MSNPSRKKRPRRYGLLAVSPFFFLVLSYVALSLYERDFSKVPMLVVFLLTSVYALLTTRGLPLQERMRHFSRGAGSGDLLLMVWIFVLAGAFAESAKQMGAISAAVDLTLLCLPENMVLAGIFVAACFVSLSIGTSVAKVFDITVGAAGLAAKHLKRMGVPYLTSVTTSSSHAGYYPGAFNLTLKLTFAPDTGRIYGAQCVGVDGVDKRIDEIAMLIKRGGTVRDLVRTEQAYAPPFSSAKDPVAIAGYVACNTLDGVMPVVTWRELAAADRSEVCLVDVRTPEEYALGTIDGAVNIPLDDLRGRLGEIDRESDVIVFCAVGLRGYLAQRILLGRGYRRVRNLAGGYKTYSLATQKVEPVEGQPCGQAEDSGAENGDMLRLDACGLQCPGPIMQVKNAVDGMKAGQRIEVRATDPGFARDAESWCRSTGNKFVSKTSEGGYHTVVIEKREACGSAVTPAAGESRDKTFIMFSDSLDRAIATFVLANGAAATGGKVTIFFTFWGLNVIKKRRKPHVEKDIFGRMFAWMLPSDSTCLHLSKMSMLGLGDRLMRHIMRRKNISQLEELMREAVYNGVELIACQMTMDMMGISRDELIDGVTVGGVATYMERAGNSGVNLFI